MGVIGKNNCDLFVYTHFGIHQERITLNPEIWKNILQTLHQFGYKYLAPEILLQKLQTLPESITLHDQAQAQPDKSKIYTQKNDSATSPVPDLLTQNALKRKLCDSPKNSSLDVFCKKGVFRNFAKFTGKHLCQSFIFNKVAGLRPPTLLKNRL